MAFTRKLVNKLFEDCGIENIPKELLTGLMNLHTETCDDIVAEKVKSLKEQVEEFEKFDVKESKEYKELHASFETFKGEIANKETNKSKADAIRKALKENGANEKFIERMTKGFDLSSVELDKNGEVKDADKVVSSFKTDWADVFGEVGKENFEPNNTGKSSGAKIYTKEIVEKMSADEINANWGEISKQLDKF